MFGLIKKMFIAIWISIVNESGHIKCVSLNNQKCMTQATLINLHPNEYSQEFQYYPFPIKIHRCVESSNTLNDLSTKVCVPSKIEYLNLSAINIITGINESKILAKHYHGNVNVNLMGKRMKFRSMVE